MNVFTRYTLRNLKKNKTRTIVTVIGIILSVAMFTAVTESLYSGQQYLVEGVKNTVGSFHAAYNDIDREKLDRLLQDKDYKEVAYEQTVGYAEIGSMNEYKPYLHIIGISENFRELVSVKLVEGRMPEREGEIVVSKHCRTDGGVDFAVGDTLTLDVGKRFYDGQIVSDAEALREGERITDTQKKIYKIVGICYRVDRTVETYSDPGYSAFTLEDDSCDYFYKAFFVYSDAPGFYKNIYFTDTEYGTAENVNSDLLMFEGYDIGSAFTPMIYGLGGILMVIIMAGSIALIYNSFSISVTERTKQFGILRSVGATNKQMVRTVLTEALILCSVAVPIGLIAGCGGIAITFGALKKEFSTIVTYAYADDFSIKLVPNALALISAAVISTVTALISAYIPARRAVKKTAIEAIRMSDDISDRRSRRKKENAGKISGIFLGFSGMLAKKNFARNRKKYRTTVVSLAMSLILFISATSICFYFQKSFDMGTDFYEYDIDVYLAGYERTDGENKRVISDIASTEGITDSQYTVSVPIGECSVFSVDKSILSTEYCELERTDPDLRMEIVFFDDETFGKICKQNGISAEPFFSSEAPEALLYDRQTYQKPSQDKKHTVYGDYSMYSFENFPENIDVYMITTPDSEEVLRFSGIVEDGYACFKVIGESDETEEKVVPIEECAEKRSLTVGAKIEKNPFSLPKKSSVLIYPESRLKDVYGRDFDGKTFTVYIQATDHSAVYERIMKETEGIKGVSGLDHASVKDSLKALMKLVSVFSYGFITLISLIAAANVFNTVSTNIMLRRKELAMLRSVGMSQKGLVRMSIYESVFYGIKSLSIGLPVSLCIAVVIYITVNKSGFEMDFSLPWGQIAFAVAIVFGVVIASMIYSVNKIKKYNTADELKNENL